MVQMLRKPEIISIARREGKVTVDGLVAYFDVTPQTIRRDLTELAERGQLERVHGGAILPSGTINIGYDERRELNQAAKADIAREVVRHIPNDCSVFLNIGTTTEAVAAALFEHSGLHIVTNNLHIAAILSSHDRVEVTLTGGTLRPADGGLVGELARASVSQFRCDYAVIGCSALHPGGDILDFDTREVGVSQAILKRSERVLLAADGSKFERKAPVRIASLAQVDAFITDRTPPSPCAEVCTAAETRLIVVDR
ncbi:MAG: DeoR/GlpR family DNA-binding transcription regulator [Pseudomonadota bacterium]